MRGRRGRAAAGKNLRGGASLGAAGAYGVGKSDARAACWHGNSGCSDVRWGCDGRMEPGQHAFMRPATRDWRRRTILLRRRDVEPRESCERLCGRSEVVPSERWPPTERKMLAAAPRSRPSRRRRSTPSASSSPRSARSETGRPARAAPRSSPPSTRSRPSQPHHRSCCRVVDARIFDARARQRGQRRGGRGAGAQRRGVRCLLQICASARGRAARGRRRRRAERADGGRGGGRSPQPRAPAARQIGRGGGGRASASLAKRADELRVTFTRTSVALDGGARSGCRCRGLSARCPTRTATTI